MPNTLLALIIADAAVPPGFVDVELTRCRRAVRFVVGQTLFSAITRR
jgi:hypothetical protein